MQPWLVPISVGETTKARTTDIFGATDLVRQCVLKGDNCRSDTRRRLAAKSLKQVARLLTPFSR